MQIAALSLKYADQFCGVVDTRGWFFCRWLKRIFASDVVGAAIGASCGGIGAVVGGIFGSLMATCVAYEEDSMAEFMNIIQNSNINQDSKNMLKTAVCVGGNSCVLWQMKESGGSESGKVETENY